MFIAKKLIASLLLPPGLFILFLAGYGSCLLYSGRRKAGIAGIAAALAFWMCCAGPFPPWLMESLEARHPAPQAVEGDVIVLLGAGAIEKVPDLTGEGVPSNEMFARIAAGVRLQKRLAVPIIVSEGKLREESTAGAVIDRRFLVDLGVDPSRIIVEDRSRDTYENALFTKKICEEHGFRRPIVLTSAYHLERAMRMFARVGLDVTGYPANFYALGRRDDHNFLRYLPNAATLAMSATAIHEYLGLLVYRK